MKMTQIFKEEAVFGVTPIRIESGEFEAVKEGDLVKVVCITKGHGFQGVVKRHGFHGGPKTHGQKNRHRAPGSIGNTTPQRVIPGRKMPGHMGVQRVTVEGIKIVSLDTANKILHLYGGVPGNIGGKVEVKEN